MNNPPMIKMKQKKKIKTKKKPPRLPRPSELTSFNILLPPLH
jgi:hypothetical protein